MHLELKAQGFLCGRHRVARLMQKHGIEAKVTRRFRMACQARGTAPAASNWLLRGMIANRPNGQWVSDMTFIPTRSGWLYLAVLMDLYSRRIVGWAMSARRTSQLVCEALWMAIRQRRPVPGTILHSDQGAQYKSEEYQRLLKEHGLICSMSRKGNCYDNAAMESFFHTLKTELVWFEDYSTREVAKTSLFEYIEAFYNRIRRHSSLHYLSPMQYELQV